MSDIRVNIWRLQAQSDIQGLIAAIENRDPGIRKRAAAALRTLDAQEAIPALTKALETEPDPDTRAHMVAALEQLSDNVDEQLQEPGQDELEQNRISMLIARLGSRDPEKIISAAQQLGELNDKLAAEPLVTAFKDSTLPIKVRLIVAQTLLKLECAPAEVSLLGAINSPDWKVRRKAIAILGRLRADWAIEPMSRLLGDEDPQVRRTAFAALKHIGTPQALAVLKVFLKVQKTRTDLLRQVQADAPESSSTSPAAQSEKPSPVGPVTAEITGVPEKRITGLLARVQTGDIPLPAVQSEAKLQEPEAAKPAAPVTPPQAPVQAAPVEIAPPEPAVTNVPQVVDEAASDVQEEAAPDKLSWPKRKPPNTIAFAPTRPLDPRVLEEARKRRTGTSPATKSGDDTAS